MIEDNIYLEYPISKRRLLLLVVVNLLALPPFVIIGLIALFVRGYSYMITVLIGGICGVFVLGIVYCLFYIFWSFLRRPVSLTIALTPELFQIESAYGSFELPRERIHHFGVYLGQLTISDSAKPIWQLSEIVYAHTTAGYRISARRLARELNRRIVQ